MRIILCFVLALVAAPASAEWMKATESEDVILYVDPHSIRNNGNFRKMWQLQDLKKRGKRGEMSRRALYEYDCKEERYRVLAVSSHSKPMAGGKTLYSADMASAWSAIPPQSAVEDLLKALCDE